MQQLIKTKQRPYEESIINMQRTMKGRGRLSWVVKGLKRKGQACLAQDLPGLGRRRFCWSHLCVLMAPCPLQDGTQVPAPGIPPSAASWGTTHGALRFSGLHPSAPHMISMLPFVNDLCSLCLSSLLGKKTWELKGQWVQEGRHLGTDSLE